MDLILCHTTVDFDALGAAVGLTRLLPGSKIVLSGGAHPAVRDFLALYRDEFTLIERRAVNVSEIRSLIIVDTQARSRIGKLSEWLELPHLVDITIYDHHPEDCDINATKLYIEPVGATTTIIAEKLQQAGISLTTCEATVMALGIHADTGSLTFENSTPRDAIALGWLMQLGANIPNINQYLEPGLPPQLQQLLKTSLDNLQVINKNGYAIGWVHLKTDAFVPGLSSLVSQLRSISETDMLLLVHEFPVGEGNETRLTIIGRSQIKTVDLNELFQPLGGGGHAQAASVNLRGTNTQVIINELIESLKLQIPKPPCARDLMSSPVRSIRPETTIAEAQRILLRYGHSGLSVVDIEGNLVGVISRRDLDIALHHGFSHAPVKGYMTTNIKTITPDTTMLQIEELMVKYDIGRLPVMDNGELVGIVTRTDILRELHESAESKVLSAESKKLRTQHSALRTNLKNHINPALWQLLTKASQEATKRGWHLYVVGGAVRDLLLAQNIQQEPLLLKDIDLVVDGFHESADAGAGVELATALQKLYPNARLDVHGAFQTAALLWHKDPELDSLWVDIATARTEFYPYPAANPEVEASSIRQDLYRRDFTINAMALRLTTPRAGELLDYFNGLIDLEARQMRVLHPNSFIEDPTRIYRGVRFAVRLGFTIESQTESYIRYAINSGVYDRTARENNKTPALSTRLKAELKLILEAPYWKRALELLDNLSALQCIHPTLKLNVELLRQLRLLERCLQRFDNSQAITHWLLRLEAIIAHLAPEFRSKVATNLQLPDDSIKRLSHFSKAMDNIAGLTECRLKSQVVGLLKKYDLETLILAALQSQRSIRRSIWQYISVWRFVQAPLNGNDLQKLGYKPGRAFKEMLDDLLAATLDGVVNDRVSAEAFLSQKYPL
ncbi:poly(A) polymerase [Dulcicalothrix desertica PCC 7102]|uniref:Poly(A) polymerase n=1 Tax=Dulcicalothrix desertica PCC 7102 TaxID=232991 RepID=A0A3S1J7E5_9CYAN|nr:CBS domain-containing protein [Dulcicalothrix desertica]RUT09101.1 poly(A) polymerase [Dulcicalothrix desertica PCC 7102]TWH55146.1 tRNA nucleotidyltransferase (CCA-adding enzyme) [Dulcicalothrix desertica PCC 7102]